MYREVKDKQGNIYSTNDDINARYNSDFGLSSFVAEQNFMYFISDLKKSQIMYSTAETIDEVHCKSKGIIVLKQTGEVYVRACEENKELIDRMKSLDSLDGCFDTTYRDSLYIDRCRVDGTYAKFLYDHLSKEDQEYLDNNFIEDDLIAMLNAIELDIGPYDIDTKQLDDEKIKELTSIVNDEIFDLEMEKDCCFAP